MTRRPVVSSKAGAPISARGGCFVALVVVVALALSFVIAFAWVQLTVHTAPGDSDMAAGFAALMYGFVGAIVAGPLVGLLALRWWRRRAGRVTRPPTST